MTEKLDAAVSAIVGVLAAIPELKQVPVNPPEQMNAPTYAVVYAQSGTLDLGPTGTRKTLHNVSIDVLTQRTDLARNMATLRPLIDLVNTALIRQVSYDSDGAAGERFGNTIDTFARLTYSWLTADYGGTPVVGYHFVMEDIKILVNL